MRKTSIRRLTPIRKTSRGFILPLIFIVLFAAIGATLLRATHASTLYTIPANIADDCSQDVTQAIDDWLASVPNGTAANPSVMQFGANKCYRVDGRIGSDSHFTSPPSNAGNNRSYLILDGNGSKIDGSYITSDTTQITAMYSGRAGFNFTKGLGLTFQNFTYIGDAPYTTTLDWTGGCVIAPEGSPSYYDCKNGGYNSNVEFQHGIQISDSQDITIRNNVIKSVWGDCIGLFQGGDTAGPNNVSIVRNAVVEGNTCDGTGRHAIGLTAGINVVIRGNTFTNIAYQVVDLEVEGHQMLRDITIENNTINYHRFGLASISGTPCTVADGGRAYDNIVIRNNNVAKSSPTEFREVSTSPDCNGKGYNLSVIGNVFHLNAGSDGDINNGQAGKGNGPIEIKSWEGLTVNGNTTHREANAASSPVVLSAVTGTIIINNNNFGNAVSVYDINGVLDGPYAGLSACGNTTGKGTNQLSACSSPSTNTPSSSTTNTTSPNTSTQSQSMAGQSSDADIAESSIAEPSNHTDAASTQEESTSLNSIGDINSVDDIARAAKQLSPSIFKVAGPILFIGAGLISWLLWRRKNNHAVPNPESLQISTPHVSFTEGGFVPVVILAAIGTPVTFINNSGKALALETARSTSLKNFEPGVLNAKDSYTYVFETPGTFTIQNKVDPKVPLSVVVK